MSYNFGPTLLSWMEQFAPLTYERIIKADIESISEHNGHGNAIAQVYNHIIMPLANEHDKETQIKWGIRDFEYRFGRKPEGMWLAETAVDDDTLRILEANGIKFTILSPYQADKFKKKEIKNGQMLAGGILTLQDHINTTSNQHQGNPLTYSFMTVQYQDQLLLMNY